MIPSKYNSILFLISKIVNLTRRNYINNVKFDIRLYITGKLKVHELDNVGFLCRQNKNTIIQQLIK